MDGIGLDGLDLCAGLLYEHRFAMLIIIDNNKKKVLSRIIIDNNNKKGA